MTRRVPVSLDLELDVDPQARTPYSVRDDYAPRFGRQVLSIWTGDFASSYVGTAHELPHHAGYMVDVEYVGKVRVECEAPRTDETWQRVDAAICAAVAVLVAARKGDDHE